MFSPSLNRPPAIDDGFSHVSIEALKCLQVLGRIRKGNEDEIASLTGFSQKATLDVLYALKKNRLVEYKMGKKIQKDKSKSVEMDSFPLWHPTRNGLSIALRSWGASKQVDFSERTESRQDLYAPQEHVPQMAGMPAICLSTHGDLDRLE